MDSSEVSWSDVNGGGTDPSSAALCATPSTAWAATASPSQAWVAKLLALGADSPGLGRSARLRDAQPAAERLGGDE
ncbi:MAG: hypothetical protein HC853_01375 [Anaerolineae bacterium]|nr:hypothetical protein [Anaerolineae bacterium]